MDDMGRIADQRHALRDEAPRHPEAERIGTARTGEGDVAEVEAEALLQRLAVDSPLGEGLGIVVLGEFDVRCRIPLGVVDTVDDARASRAAAVPFIGIAASGNPRYGELVTLLREEGAVAILDDINGLEAAIATNR